jgi:hypothetical protein
MERAAMKVNAVHLRMVVDNCRYLVLLTLKKVKGPRRQTKHATYILK